MNLDYTKIFAIIIILVIITFLAVIFLPKPKSYYQPINLCKELLLLEKDENFNFIKKEIEEFAKNNINEKKYFELTLYEDSLLKTNKNETSKNDKNENGDTSETESDFDETKSDISDTDNNSTEQNVNEKINSFIKETYIMIQNIPNIKNFQFGQQKTQTFYFHKNIDKINYTYNILQNIPNIKKIKLVNIPTNYISTNKKSHSSDTLECLLPVKCAENKKDHIWCDGEKRFFKNSELIIFDHTRQHQFIVKHKHDNVLLLSIIIENSSYF